MLTTSFHKRVFKQIARDLSWASLNRKEYDRLWNKQPMHHKCNKRRGMGYNRGWPIFDCECHFLYFHNGHSFIYALEDCPDGTWEWQAHGFIPQVVTHQAYDAPMNIGVVLLEKWHNREGTYIGYHGTGEDRPVRGHQFPLTHPDQVMLENALNISQVGLLHRGALYAGKYLDMLYPLPTTGGNRLEENYLVLPETWFGLGCSLHVPLTVVIPRGALLNWDVPPLGKHVLKRVTPTARNKMPLEPTWIWWAGGQPATTKGDEVRATTAEWFDAVRTSHDTREISKLANSPALFWRIPHDTQKIPVVRSGNYRPAGNEGTLNQWDLFVPDQSAGRAIPPPLSRKEQAYFSQEEQQ